MVIKSTNNTYRASKQQSKTAVKNSIKRALSNFTKPTKQPKR